MKFKSNIELQAGLEDNNATLGTSGQVLSSTGTGVEWIDQAASTSTQSNFVYFEVKNETGSTINKGKGVMAVGTDGNSGHILIDEMVADGTVESKYFLGVLETSVDNGGFARVISFGELDQFNTLGQNGETWLDGQVLWCDPDSAGDFTITEPDGPNVKIAAAFILNAATNGKIQVRVQANEGIHDLHDTRITSQVDGDILVWDNTDGVWFNNSTLNVDYTLNRVGIGNPSPSYKLDVNGDGRFTGSVTATDFIGDWNGLNTGQFLRSDEVDVKTNGYLQFNDNISVVLGSDIDSVLYHTGSAQYLDMNTGDFYIRDNTTLKFTFGRTTGNFTATGEVQGTKLISTGVANNWGVQTTINSGTSGLWNTTTKTDLYLRTGATLGAYITPSGTSYFNGGNVGIGTTTTSAKTHIFNSSVQNGLFVENSSSSFVDSAIFANNTSTTNGNLLRLRSSGSDRMVVLGNGNVGIGTVSPSEKLEVEGSVNNDDVAIKIENTYDDNLSTSRPAAALTFATASNNGHLRVYGAPADTAANHQIDLGSTAGSSYLTFSPSSTEKMRINSNGNVGIGTTIDSGYKLDVSDVGSDLTSTTIVRSSLKGIQIQASDNVANKGGGLWFNHGSLLAGIASARANTGAWGTDLRFYTHDDSITNVDNVYERMRISPSGNVGIGTPDPATPLHVSGGAAGTDGWNKTATLEATYPGLIFNSNDTKWGGMAYDHSAAMRFWVNASNDDIFAGTSAMSILNNGSVCIGTASTSYKLDVNGTGRFTSTLTASGGINGLTNTNGISGSNFNITGVNQININDPGEGILFGGGTNNVTLYAIDDSTDNKMNFGGASELQVNGNTVWHAGNDGGGSGLDADTLDTFHASTTRNSANTIPVRDGNGYLQLGWINTTSGTTTTASSDYYVNTNDGYIRKKTLTDVRTEIMGVSSGDSFLRSDTSDTVNAYTSNIRFPSNTAIESTSAFQASLEVYQSSPGDDAFMAFHVGGDYAAYFGLDGSTNDFAVGGWSMGANKYKVWHQGNDGPSSGLDADTLDGVQGNNYVQGTNSNRTGASANMNVAQPSGFYDNYNGNGTPTDTWYTFINARHNNESNNYGSQIACSFYDTQNFYVRNISNGSYGTWAKIWNSSNDGAGSGLDADNLDGVSWGNVNTNIVTSGDLYVNGGNIFTGTSVNTRVKVGVYSDSTFGMGFVVSTTYGGLSSYAVTFQNSNDNARGFWWGDSTHTNAQGAMALTTDGRLTVANYMRLGYGEADTTSPGTTYRLQVNGTIQASNFILSSDENLKKNISNYSPKPIDVEWKTFEFKDEETRPGTRLGVIAQEVEKNHPEFVTTDEEGLKSVDYIEILIAKIAELEDRIKILEG